MYPNNAPPMFPGQMPIQPGTPAAPAVPVAGLTAAGAAPRPSMILRMDGNAATIQTPDGMTHEVPTAHLPPGSQPGRPLNVEAFTAGHAARQNGQPMPWQAFGGARPAMAGLQPVQALAARPVAAVGPPAATPAAAPATPAVPTPSVAPQPPTVPIPAAPAQRHPPAAPAMPAHAGMVDRAPPSITTLDPEQRRQQVRSMMNAPNF